jgi:hypothetical protein
MSRIDSKRINEYCGKIDFEGVEYNFYWSPNDGIAYYEVEGGAIELRHRTTIHSPIKRENAKDAVKAKLEEEKLIRSGKN